ncbi:carbon-nitrogen hydrolase family protein [Oceanisphaera avium]|uniref:Amidohydrolase n=1 Tax=Oceanisphaera avium TaxID=1903694 RepID=A0A1Y0CZP1_9GAMM|nr:carbon-nitrogen hydrolase family protein [Oceanisphaera avium]ART80802.1 amidohydrolase [Oceanisphaera avium]
MQLVALQMHASSIWADNRCTLASLLEQLPSARPLLVLLPENAVVFGNREAVLSHAEYLGEGPIQAQFSDWAKQHNIWLVVGSMPTHIEHQDAIHATSLVYNEQGQRVGHYHKLHLFDVDVADSQGRYRESDTFSAGEELCLIDSPFGRLGLSICYDLRFAHLYNALREQGAEILLVPAAFTQVTGQAHWQPLLQARAIENQCYVIAAGLVGEQGSRPTWGHSMIIDPWGEIKASLATGSGLVTCPLDSAHLMNIRRQMPVAEHARFSTTWRNK